MRKRAVPLLIALVLLSDAVIVALAAANRRGEPECVVTLTERELALPAFRAEESTGLGLSLAFGLPRFSVQRVADRRGVARAPVGMEWLDDAKLAALGFRTSWEVGDPTAMERYAARAVRPVYAVLEMEGEGHARQLATRERELEEARAGLAAGKTDIETIADLEALLALERTMGSRLVQVDAGRDPAALRARHPDRSRCCIVPALIRLALDRPEGERPRLRGRVEALVGEIDVPLRLRPRLAPFLPGETQEQAFERLRQNGPKPPWPAARPPRYEVTLAFGRRHEPWILDIAPLGG